MTVLSDREYQVTLERLADFTRAAEAAQGSVPRPGMDPRIHAALVESIAGEVPFLRRQLRRYERVKAGQVSSRKIRSLFELPDALVEARIARNMTQKQLAERLEIAEQQVQRYEQNRYDGASIGRLMAVAEALGVRLEAEVHFARRRAKPKATTKAKPKAKKA